MNAAHLIPAVAENGRYRISSMRPRGVTGITACNNTFNYGT
jgi:hypothetical protein